MTTTVLVAGATGMLGGRIATELIDQLDVDVRLMLRASALGNTAKTRAVDALVSDGAVVALGDVTDPDSLDKATAGVDVVVSALQGSPTSSSTVRSRWPRRQCAAAFAGSFPRTSQSTCITRRRAHLNSTSAAKPTPASTRCRLRSCTCSMADSWI